MIAPVSPGVVAASYAKIVVPATNIFTPFLPTGGGRRAYGANGTFAAPNFTDNPGVTWAAGGPSPAYLSEGWIVQVKLTMSKFESINAAQTTQDHHYAFVIGATELFEVVNDTVSTAFDTGWVTVPSGLSGAITFRDWGTNPAAGGSGDMGTLSGFYQYIRP